MKKFLVACGAAALMLGVASCDGNSSKNGAAGDDSAVFSQGLADSISNYMGASSGAQFAERLKTIPEPDRSKVKKEAFLRGFKQVIMADTSDLGYIYGLSVGLQMASQINMMEQNGLPVNREEIYNQFAKAFKQDSVDQQKLSNDMMAFQGLMGKFQQKMLEKQQAEAEKAQAELAAQAAENEAAGKAFVEEAKKADSSIKTTESGLSYKVDQQGSGAAPTGRDRVKVNYTGKLIDGTVFDSSNGEPREFSLGGVIPGFAEGLKLMNKGSKYTLYIPGELAYGVQGTPDGSIPAGATLIFEVEMVDFTPAQ